MIRQQKTVISIFMTLMGIVILTMPARTLAYWLIDDSGTLVQTGLVLGDDEQEVEELESEEVEDETTKREAEQKREMLKQKLENETEARKQTLEKKREEMKTSFEIQKEKMIVKQERINEKGKVMEEKKTELKEKEAVRVERRERQFEVSMGEDEQMRIRENEFETKTKFPISIGENNELIVTKKDGSQKVVTILPAQAAEKMRERGLAVTSGEVELVDVDGEPVYQFDAKEEKKFLGLFKAQFQTKTSVSSETGEVVNTESTETSPLRKLMELLSF